MASRLFAKLSRIRSIAPVNLKTSVPRCSAYAYYQPLLGSPRAAMMIGGDTIRLEPQAAVSISSMLEQPEQNCGKKGYRKPRLKSRCLLRQSTIDKGGERGRLFP